MLSKYDADPEGVRGLDLFSGKIGHEEIHGLLENGWIIKVS